MRRLLVPCLLIAACAAPPVGPGAARQAVHDTEQAFAASMAARDIEAFADFLADEAVFVQDDGVLKGRAAIVAGWSRYFDEPEAPFSWRPALVEVLDSGRLALSTGPVYGRDGRCVGGGFWVCPDAEPTDGRFDICIARRMSYPETLRALPRVMRGSHAGLPKVEMHRATQVTIQAMGPDPLFFQLDGELHEPAAARELRFRVIPGVLPVLRAQAAS